MNKEKQKMISDSIIKYCLWLKENNDQRGINTLETIFSGFLTNEEIFNGLHQILFKLKKDTKQ